MTDVFYFVTHLHALGHGNAEQAEAGFDGFGGFSRQGYAGVVAEAARALSPAVVAQYAYEVAKSYNRFYTEVPILKEADPTKKAFRVALSAKTAETIKTSLGLLGIAVPERM